MLGNSYKLPALHEKLRENGLLDQMEVAPSYRWVVARVARREDQRVRGDGVS